MGNRKLGLGSAELTKLWGKSESNLEACKTPKRQFIPQVDAYFEEAIMQSDPKNEIEVDIKYNSVFEINQFRININATWIPRMVGVLYVYWLIPLRYFSLYNLLQCITCQFQNTWNIFLNV